MKLKKLKVRSYIFLSLFAMILAALIFGNVMCYLHAGEITSHLVGLGINTDPDKSQSALAEGDELVRAIADEGIVLLKNNGTLPLTVTQQEYKINLFGVGSTPDGFTYSGIGSGASTILKEDVLNADGSVKYKRNRVSLQEGLEFAGFKVNNNLLAKYAGGNPDASFYSSNDTALSEAKSFSDTAIVTISRVTGENVAPSGNAVEELYYPGSLQLKDEETAMVNYVGENFDKVIVIINSTNVMEMGYLTDDKIDAALNVGALGQSGTKSIGRILSGAVNPSAKLADTAPYDTTLHPSYANGQRTGGGGVGAKQITYAEDIYLGYKWYETADHMNYFADVDNGYGKGYAGTVQYPFGSGLSYTSFKWELESATRTVGDETKNISDNGMLTSSKTKINLSVKVTNTGDLAGKDVVQVYYNAPYYNGEIEKSYINLVAFDKTGIIKPGESESVEISFDIYDMASFDCYDKNGNGVTGWELDPGKYNIKIMKDAHTPSECQDVVVEVPSTGTASGRRGFLFRFDIDSKGYVKNRFTGPSAEAGTPIDGSSFGGDPIVYFSRADFKGTFPGTKVPKRTGDFQKLKDYYYKGLDGMTEFPMPALRRTEGDMYYLYTLEDGSPATANDLDGKGAKLVANEELIMELGKDYKSEKWDLLLSQISPAEIELIVGAAGFGTRSAVSIGKPRFLDFDGPSGFNSKITSGGDSVSWTAFPAECVLACTWNQDLAYQMGFALGSEAKVTGGMTGIYAPTVNLHRSAYHTRNYEAYSEDPVISGYLAAAVIRGAKNNGLSCYLKHLALSELGWNPNDVNTWLTEQNFRETYLKAFEIAVKKGNANAVMSAFNNVGGIPAIYSRTLLTDVLRKEWGFKGVVITDYNVGDTRKHVRSGNDLHLTPNDNAVKWLDESDKASVYAGYLAVKNSVYTYCNTYYQAKIYNPDAELGLATMDDVFAWWIPVLITLDVLCVGAIGFYVFRLFKPRKNAESAAEANAA